MAFSEYTIKYAWKRAGGFEPPTTSYCECTSTTHDHDHNRCNKPLSWAYKSKEGSGAWEAHSFSGKQLDSPFDCAIFCWKCHKST
jgi:hypothetical protein